MRSTVFAVVFGCLLAGALWCQMRAPAAYYEDTNNIPDPGYSGVKGMADMLTGKKVKVIWNQSGGGHSWPNWQVYLSKYAPLLFRD